MSSAATSHVIGADSRRQVAIDFPTHPRTGRTMPVHYWRQALRWSGVIILGMVAIYVLEKYVLGLKGTPMRMVHNPSEMAVRFFGLAHYTVATYLLLTSKKLHHWRGFLMLGLFSMLSVAVCLLFHWAGGGQNKLAVVGVFFFFLMHALRDEVFFYRMRAGKAIAKHELPHVYRMSLWLQVAGLLLLAGILYPAFTYKYYQHPVYGAAIEQFYSLFPASWPLALQIAIVASPFFVFGIATLLYIHRRHSKGIVDFLRSHAPLTVIVGGTFLLAAGAVIGGSWLLNLVILTHFTGWFVFAVEGILRQPKAARDAITWRTPNIWIRRNLVGFWVFHGGLAVLFLALIAVNHWGLGQRPMTVGGVEKSNLLTLFFGRDALYYWTLAHVTLGFTPKPSRPTETSAA